MGLALKGLIRANINHQKQTLRAWILLATNVDNHLSSNHDLKSLIV